MMKHEFYYTSRDSVTKIHAIEWLPDREIKGVLQICHGMVEYIDRYDEFAEFMSEHGYYVVGHDHLGHGKSIQTEIDLGYFDERERESVCDRRYLSAAGDDTEKISGCAVFYAGAQYGVIPVETVSDDVCGGPCGSCHYGNRSSGNADALCGKDDLQDHCSVQRMEIQKYICG